MIISNKKYSFIVMTVLFLFLVAPFVMSFEDAERAERLYARMLPSIVSDFANVLRWLGLVVLAIFTISKVQKSTKFLRISIPVWLLSGFYFIQLIYAFIDGTDIFRFFLLTILSLLVPPAIGFVLLIKPKIQKYFVYCIGFFLFLSILLNGHLILAGQRFFGFMNNPNAYGISTVFWMVVLLLAESNKKISKSIFLFVFIGIFSTMLFSGSRNGMVGVVLIVLLNYFTQAKRFVYVLLIGTFALIVITNYIDSSFVVERLLNISNSFEDSGRTQIWQRAYSAIDKNLWWGNGMDAHYLIAETGNMHNSYIRFVLNMGLIFTIFTILFYLSSITVTITRYKVIPLILSAYLIAYALMNIGEDFFLGVGSSAYIYILFIFGYINSYFVRENILTEIKIYTARMRIWERNRQVINANY